MPNGKINIVKRHAEKFCKNSRLGRAALSTCRNDTKRIILFMEENMDRFFTQKTCDRCGAELKVRQMSRFNTDVLCPACIAEEKQDVEQEQNVNQNLLILFHKNLVNNFFYLNLAKHY